MPRFVILEHDHPHRHWDFMLESGEVLRTWRLENVPEVDHVIRAEPLGDHRLAYLDYEGPVSGNRGTVKRWDFGSFTWTMDQAVEIAVELNGARVKGTMTLQKCSSGG